jgi:nickel transport protein
MTVYFAWMKGVFGFALTVFLFLTAASPAAAHRVIIFAWVEGNTVYTESKFPGGKKVNKGRILVYDPHGKQLLEGETNEQGEFAFTIPERSALRIILEAGAGHRAEWTVPLEEIEGTASDPVDVVPIASTGAEETEQQAQLSATPGMGADEIQLAVEKALDKKLKPIVTMLVRSQTQGPTIKDILGGVGYILGLVGVASYFHYRRNKTDGSAS